MCVVVGKVALLREGDLHCNLQFLTWHKNTLQMPPIIIGTFVGESSELFVLVTNRSLATLGATRQSSAAEILLER